MINTVHICVKLFQIVKFMFQKDHNMVTGLTNF